MSRNNSLVALVVCAMAFLAWTMAGCGSSSSPGTGSIQISLVDAPFDASEVNVDIASVQVHKSDSGWQTIKTFPTPLEVNLLDYRSQGDSLLLVDSPLDAGHYTMVRLMITGAELVIGGQTYPVDIQNVQETGVKCNGQFTVESGQLVALILDFNAGRSFVDTGSGNYMLHPVMTMSPVNVATEVSGKVEFHDANDAVIALPEGVIVNVYPKDHAGESALLVASAVVEADGTFKFTVLPQGTYDIQILLDGGTVVKTVEDAVVTPPSTDLGTIVVTPSP